MIIDSAESIDVRDDESEQYLKRCGLKNVTKTCDDVFLAPLDQYIRCDEETEHESGRLILAVHGNCGRDNEIIDFCYRLAKFHPNSLNGVICLLFGDEDIRTAERIAVALGDKYSVTFRRFKELYEGGLVLRRNDYAFTTKFHGHLLLSLAGLRGMVSSIDQHYYDIKQHSLLKLGSQYKAVGLHDHYFGERDLDFDGGGGGLRFAYPLLNEMKAELVKAIFADVEAPVVEHACLGVLPTRESVLHMKENQVVPDVGTALDTLTAVQSMQVQNLHQ
ncbi:polysaccharide pyruvyl transferase family protein [Burkholderia multivorans]|uniref:polysaccharide pyruvyl transferase family protein n=1 Tax=Burkholderia multivorans TaxID=87883 RepID=UPI001C23FD18|nr:polysaccharide pyruvyl transferase family protein [Burkholderia multivorans]